jgi:transposase
MQGKDSNDRMPAYVGIDVCKAWLDACVSAGTQGIAWRLPNTGAGVRELLRRRGGLGVRRVALEATGRMHLAAWAALAEAGLAVVVLNPYRARKFADALGRLAKTDRIDARILALAAERLDAAPAAPPSPERLSLKELAAVRRNLVARKVALTNQLAATTDAFARRLLATEQAMIVRHLGGSRPSSGRASTPIRGSPAS